MDPLKENKLPISDLPFDHSMHLNLTSSIPLTVFFHEFYSFSYEFFPFL